MRHPSSYEHTVSPFIAWALPIKTNSRTLPCMAEEPLLRAFLSSTIVENGWGAMVNLYVRPKSVHEKCNHRFLGFLRGSIPPSPPTFVCGQSQGLADSMRRGTKTCLQRLRRVRHRFFPFSPPYRVLSTWFPACYIQNKI